MQPNGTSPVDAVPWSRVEFALPGSWVEEEPYDTTIAAAAGLDLTYLCLARQVDAGSGRSFHATAVRLESGPAAQRASPWSIRLDACVRTLTLHWLRVRRGGVRTDRLRRERLRLRQDEPEGQAPDGSWTLLAALDDLWPGDIVEAAYTCEMHDPVRPGGCEVLFLVPPRAVVGRHRLSVRLAMENASLRWLASPDAPERRETILADGGRRWSWEGAQITPRAEEPNTPASRMDFVWVQVSDLPDWSVLAERMAAARATAEDSPGSGAVAPFTRPEQIDEDAIVRLVAYLQDEFHHLGHYGPPEGRASPAALDPARRPWVQGKDLVWQAVTVLRGWGVRARPVLVSAAWRETIVDLLPMAEIFDHAVLEVEFGGSTRWFDLAESGQGGGFEARAVPWFGHGVPLDGADKGLCVQPGARARGVYALRETVLLDTTRSGVSVVEQRVRAEGWPADLLRRALRAQGDEAFAEAREQEARRRHGQARRLGDLRWRDDPAANVFELVEVFELSGAMHPEERGLRAVHTVAPGLVAGWFSLPEDKLRHGPWALSFPCELRHTLVIKAPGLTAGAGRRRRWAEPEFEGSQEDTRLNGVWTRACRFTTLVPEVSARRLPAYRKALEEYLREAGWRIYLPWGRTRLRRGKGFGELDEAPASEKPAPAPADHTAAPKPAEPAGSVVTAEDFKRESRGRSRRRSGGGGSSRRPESKTPAWVWKVGLSFVAIVMLGLLRGCLG